MNPLPRNIKDILEKIEQGKASEAEIALLGQYISEHFPDVAQEDFFERHYSAADDAYIKTRLRQAMHPENPVPRKAPAAIAWGIASLFLLAGIFLFYRLLWNAEKIPVYTVNVQTLAWEKKKIILPDSSQVWLNRSSHIQYGLNPNTNRREVLLEGEATFEVKHNAEIPFAVITGRLSTVDIGTRFNVNAYEKEDRIKIDVLEGSVYVSDGDKKINADRNESVVYVRQSELLEKKKTLLPQHPAWHSLSFNYKEIAMHDLVKELKLYYNIQLTIPSGISDCHIYAHLGDTGIDQSLRLIAESVNGRLVKRNESTFEIQGGSCQ